MSDEWLNKIHDRMSDYEVDEPDELWASIEAAQGSDIRRKCILVWVRRSVAVAAMLVAVISTAVYLMRDDIALPKLAAPEMISYRPTVPGPGNLPLTKVSSDRAVGHLIRHDKAVGLSGVVMPQDSVCQNDAVAVSTVNEAQDTVDTVDTVDIKTVRDITDTAGDYIAAVKHNRRDNGGSFSLSMYTSGGTGALFNNQSGYNAILNSVGPQNSQWRDDPMLGILLFNQGKAVNSDIKHRLPVRAGISVVYNLNDRFGIESGLSYTNLTSDIKEGSGSHYYSAVQRLHYIGLPLNVKYRIWSWKSLDFYASGGGLVEKCVAATLDCDYFIDNHKNGGNDESISDRPWQFSVNASAGVQCNIVKSVGIYVEPGISYYFDDGSQLRTIYKDKPLNFNLNLGVRFLFRSSSRH